MNTQFLLDLVSIISFIVSSCTFIYVRAFSKGEQQVVIECFCAKLPHKRIPFFLQRKQITRAEILGILGMSLKDNARVTSDLFYLFDSEQWKRVLAGQSSVLLIELNEKDFAALK